MKDYREKAEQLHAEVTQGLYTGPPEVVEQAIRRVQTALELAFYQGRAFALEEALHIMEEHVHEGTV